MDEKLMMMEQERSLREKKHKKNKKRMLIGLGIAVIVIVAAVVAVLLVRMRGGNKETTVSVVTQPGQNVVYAQLVKVNGNEITYRVAQETDGEMPEGMEEMGERPEMPEGMKEMGEMPEMPEGMKEMGERPEMPEGMEEMMGGAGDADSTFSYDGKQYRLTGETITCQIPVGTDVTTRLGAVTTFSRLAAGDNVALVMEEEDGEQVIMAIYIIG